MLVKAAPGLDWTILRPPAVYGPGDRETLAFFKAARLRRPFLPGSAGHRTSLLHVADLAAAIVATIDIPAMSGRVAEVHDGEPKGYAFAEVLEMIHGAPGFHRPVFVPGGVLRLAGGAIWLASLASGRLPMLTPEKVRELTHADWVCRDTTLADAGWRVVSWDLRGHGDSDHAHLYSWDADLRDAAAYGDSRHDLCLLQAVGHPVAVQPDQPLLATARGNRWDIIVGGNGPRIQPQ